MKTKKFVAEIVTAALLVAGVSTPAIAQADNLQSSQLQNANNSKEQLKQNNSESVNTTDIADDLIPAPTQHFGESDGKLPEVETSISYETENSDVNQIDGDRTDGDRTDANQTGSNQTKKILLPGSRLTLHATAKFTVPENGDVFRPYLRLAIPKVLTVDVNNFEVDAGEVASKVVELPNSSTFANYNLFDVYFNYNEWSSDFATEMPHLAALVSGHESGNVLGEGDVLASNQQVNINIPATVSVNASPSDLVNLSVGKRGVKPAIQGRVSYMPFPKSIDYTSEIGGIEKFQDDSILQKNPCLIRSDLVTGWKGQGDYGFWFTGLAMETSGVDYEGRHTAVRSSEGYTFNQLIPADLKYNQFVTIRRNDSDNNPIILKLKMPAASENYVSNSAKQKFSNGNLTVFRWPNTNDEALKLMENAGIDKVQYNDKDVFGDTLPEKSFADWGTYESQNRPAELFVSGVFNSDSTVFGPDDISKGIWLQGNSKASITTYYESPSCESAYNYEELAYPPIISKIQETVATYARSDRSGVNTVPIEIAIPVPASLSGRVWFDANKNGIQDPGELSVPDAKVELVGKYNQKITDIDGKEIKAVITGSDGSYKFTNLKSGEYKVKFTIPDNSKYVGFTTANQGWDDTRDSDAIPVEPITDRSAGVQNGVGTGSAGSNSKEANVSSINIPEGGNKENVDAGVIANDEAPKDPKPKDPNPKQTDPKPNPKQPEPKSEPEPQPKNPKNPDPKTTHGQDRDSDPEPQSQPEPKTTPEPDPKKPEPTPKPEPKTPEPQPEPEPEPQPQPQPQPEPQPEPQPQPQPKTPEPKTPKEPKEPKEPKNPEPKIDERKIPEPKNSNVTNIENKNNTSNVEKHQTYSRKTVSKLAKTGVSTVLVAVFALAMFAVGGVKGLALRTRKGKHRQ